MTEREIWRVAYDFSMKVDGENSKLFAKELLTVVADNITRNIDPKKMKKIFVDVYNMLDVHLNEPNWIAVSELSEKLIHNKYGADKDEQLLCAELVSVVVNHLGRVKDSGNTSAEKR